MIKLIRLNDQRKFEADDYGFITFKLSGTSIDKICDTGKHLMLSPFNECFTWQTTAIVSYKQYKNFLKFKTKNSTYKLFTT